MAGKRRLLTSGILLVVVLLACLALGVPSVSAAGWPDIKSVDPTVLKLDNYQWFNVYGSGFQVGASIVLMQPGQKDVQTLSAVHEGTKVICLTDAIDIPAPGNWDVKVTNPDGQSDILDDGVTVVPCPMPFIKSIDPPVLPKNGWKIFKINGSGFCHGAKVTISKSGQPTYEFVAVVNSNTQITAAFLDTVTTLAVGRWSVTVTNPDGKTYTKAGCLGNFP